MRYPERVETTPGLAVGAGELKPSGRGSAGVTTWGIQSGEKTSRAGRGWCDGVMLRAARQGSSSIVNEADSLFTPTGFPFRRRRRRPTRFQVS